MNPVRRSVSTWAFVGIVVLLPITVFGIVELVVNRYDPVPVLGPKDHRVAPFSFTNQAGKEVTLDHWRGNIVVANFFFTHCPSVCPKMTANLKRVQAYAGVDNLQIASFTVDPVRDSAGQLQVFARKWNLNGNWDLLTGSKPALYKAARNSFMITATEGDGGPDDFIHSENLVLIDQEARIRGYYDGTNETAVNNLVRDLKKLARE